MLARVGDARSGRGRVLERSAAASSLVGAGSGLIAYGSVSLVALTHVGDWYHVDHVSGVWMGLAKYLREGVLYPPLFEDGIYGGTRYMPLKIVIDTGASILSGEYLVSGKVVGLIAFAVLGLVILVALRAAGCPLLLAIALSGIPVATGNGFVAATSNFGDTLPVVFQLAALASVAQHISRRRAASAGLLCGIALFAKLSAVWGPAAVLAWLLWRRRTDAAVAFAVALTTFSVATVALIEVVSHDRFRQNFEGIANSGSLGLYGLLHVTPHKLVSTVEESAPSLLVLAPLVLGAYVLLLWLRRLTIYHLALPLAAGVLVLVMNDIGAAENHLLDVEILTATVIGATWPWLAGRRYGHAAETVAAGIVCLALVIGYVQHLSGPTRDAARELTGRTAAHPVNPLGRNITPADTLLSQDASIPVSLGRTPVVLDAYMLLRIDRDHPAWGDRLIQRLDGRQFDKVVMMGVPDPDALWWQGHHFGPRIAAAIFRNYRRSVTLNDYSIFVPREAGGS